MNLVTATSTRYGERLQQMRTQLQALNLAGFLLPLTDEFQNEYLPSSAKRLEYLCGFTGSAGLLAILPEVAALFTDGRYTTQAAGEISPDLFQVQDSQQTTLSSWLLANLPAGARLGYDPWLVTESQQQHWQSKLAAAQITLVAISPNPVDGLWLGRPAAPATPIIAHPIIYAGESSSSKITRLAAELSKAGQSATLLTDPASIAWLLNVRATDVPHTPLPLSYAVLQADGTVHWLVDAARLDASSQATLPPSVILHPFSPNLDEAWANVINQIEATPKILRYDPQLVPLALLQRWRHAGWQLAAGPDVVALSRATKNATELAGAASAHLRDGVALCEFLAWLATQDPSQQDELTLIERLHQARAAQPLFRDESFPTICGSGPHGAIVHYRTTSASNRRLQFGDLLLLDSGGQYANGTTDVTRTLAIGTPTPMQREHFTRVLLGHAALAQAVFPAGTYGSALDSLARQFLWQAGLDFSHGTGHGVGSYLSVHEGPHSISRRHTGEVALAAGMLVTNEPGYYLPGAYGIRLENMLEVIEAPVSTPERKFLAFRPLTLVPFDNTLLEPRLLTPQLRDWLNHYHRQVATALMPLLSPAAAAWLQRATAAI